MEKSSHFKPLEEEYVEIIPLPLEVPSEGPNLVGEYMARKEQEQEMAFHQMKEDLKKTNEEISQQIWWESMNLKMYLTQGREMMEGLMDYNLRNYFDKLVELEAGVFDMIRFNIDNHERDCFEMIDNYYLRLKNTEMRRMDSFKIILKHHYDKLQKISYKLPNELLEFFETEILRLNQVTLGNYQHYVDLHAELKLQTEQFVNLLRYETKQLEDEYKSAMTTTPIIQVVDLKFQTCDIFEIIDEEKQITIMEKVSMETEEVADVTTTCPTSTETLDTWYNEVRSTLDTLDLNAKKLVELYKTAIISIFNRFFDELQKITSTAMHEEHLRRTLSETTHDKEIRADYFKHIIEDVTSQNNCEVADLQNLWDSVTSYMQTNIKNTYGFLDGSTHLWDAHFDRINTVQSLILQDLHNTIEKNNKAAKNFETKINKAVDTLRQAATVSRLDLNLKETNKLLDSVADLFSKQCDVEIEILEKYREMMEKEIDVFLAEIGRFLDEYSNDNRSEQSVDTTDTLSSIDEMNENLVPHQMKRCKIQVEAVNNWMFGLWEALRIYTITCRKELTEEAKQWVTNQMNKLKKRLEVRLVAHKPRYARIKHSVYDVRLKEIENHEKNMASIDKAMIEYMAASRIAIKECRDKQLEELDKHRKAVAGIEEKVKSAKRSLQILSYLERTNAISIKTKERLEQNFDENRRKVEENLEKIKEVINDVTSSLKLFSDGGDYSHEEVKVFLKTLSKESKALPKKYSKIFDETAAVKREILNFFQTHQSNAVARLERSQKEFEHNESAILKIRKLRNDIHRKVHCIKYKLMRIESAVEYFIIMSKIQLWKRKNFELMKSSLLDCLEKMTELTAALIWNNNEDNNSSNADEIYSNEDVEEENKNYLSELNGIVQRALDDIEMTAKVFYQQHSDVMVNTDKIQPTYELFMEEILKNFNSYKRQVKINSLECSEELIGSVLKLLKITDEVYRNLAKKYPQVLEEEEKGELEKIYDKLSRESSLMETTRKSLAESESEDEVKEDKEEINPDVVDLIQENNTRANFLHCLINKLFNHLKEKLELMATVVEEEESEEEITVD